MTVSIIQLKMKNKENVCRPCLSAGYGELWVGRCYIRH